VIRLTISRAAYEAMTATLPKGWTAYPHARLEVGESVGLWLDHTTVQALRRKRKAGEGYSETILRLAKARSGP
jgi:hypothetical protein